MRLDPLLISSPNRNMQNIWPMSASQHRFPCYLMYIATHMRWDHCWLTISFSSSTPCLVICTTNQYGILCMSFSSELLLTMAEVVHFRFWKLISGYMLELLNSHFVSYPCIIKLPLRFLPSCSMIRSHALQDGLLLHFVKWCSLLFREYSWGYLFNTYNAYPSRVYSSIHVRFAFL